MASPIETLRKAPRKTAKGLPNLEEVPITTPEPPPAPEPEPEQSGVAKAWEGLKNKLKRAANPFDGNKERPIPGVYTDKEVQNFQEEIRGGAGDPTNVNKRN